MSSLWYRAISTRTRINRRQYSPPSSTTGSCYFVDRHGWLRVEGEASAKCKFKAYPVGYFHIDIAEVRTVQGRLYLLVAIDRTSRFAFVELLEATTRVAADYLRRLIAAVPYKVHIVPSDNGTHFTQPRGETWTPAEIRDLLETQATIPCACVRIRRRTTGHRPSADQTAASMDQWTGRADEPDTQNVTVKRYFCETHDQSRTHLTEFVMAYNFARRLKTLKGLTRSFRFTDTHQRSTETFFTVAAKNL